jgi:hypothetical protein
MPSLLNKAEVKRRLIQHAKDTRSYWNGQLFEPGVRKETLDTIEANVSAHIRSIVEKLPSKGKRI